MKSTSKQSFNIFKCPALVDTLPTSTPHHNRAMQ